MGLQWFMLLSIALNAGAIRVPLDGEEAGDTQHAVVVEDTTPRPAVDSYLVPPDPYTQDYQGESQTPATYLLPPPVDAQSYYQAEQQTGWEPVTNKPKIYQVKETDKQERGERFLLPIPSEQLQPPAVSAPDQYAAPPPALELELPLEDSVRVFSPSPSHPPPPSRPRNVILQPANPTLAFHLIPPKYQEQPTKIYPKKYQAFRPVPIPIGQFVEKPFNGVPRAKPLKPFKPFLSPGAEHAPRPDPKKIYLYEQAEQKRKLKGDGAQAQVVQPVPAQDPSSASEEESAEQQAAETSARHPGRNSYPAPLRQAPPTAPPAASVPAPAPGERTEFRMHGMKGPHSYQFGYDTGKGKNRQFRYEERDNDGHVRGHYGYMDRAGKLRVVNYDADPKLGFRADAPKEEEP